MRRALVFILCVLLALGGASLSAEAQKPERVYRIGVVMQGGVYEDAVIGLREGLRELGLEEGKHYALLVRDTKGITKALEPAARQLEQDNVDLIFSLSTSTSLAVKRATSRVPIVFYAGLDPIANGLVGSFAKPGGRVTGIYGWQGDLAAKRLELLKAIVPNLRRILTLYNPNNRTAVQAVKLVQDAARQLKVELVEQRVTLPEELREAVRAIKPLEGDAFFYVPDAMVTSQNQVIVDAALVKRLPTMFTDTSTVGRGALASYGISYHAVGKLSARYVQQILQGTAPGDLPIERMDRVSFAVNLKTAKTLGLTISQSVLNRADEVIQ